MSTSSTTSNSERKIMRGDDVANNNMTTIIKIGSHSSVIISHGNTSSVSESSSKTAGRQQEGGKEDTRINLTKIRELDDTEEDSESSSDFDDVTVSHRDEGITASPKSSTSGASTLSSGIESGISCGGGDSVVVVGGGGAMHHPMSTRSGHYLSFILFKLCNQGSWFERYEREKFLA